MSDHDDIDDAIMLGLAEQPFASARDLSRLTHISLNSVHRLLTISLCSTVRHIQYEPHVISDALKRIRFRLSGEFLQLRQIQGDMAWHGMTS
jgi:hypothetical protein